MGKDRKADEIITGHVVWSLGAGLMPVPLFDIAAVTAVQMDMLKQMAELYEADFSKATGKTFVSALTGSTFARIGAPVIKAVPGLSTVVGGVSMSVMSGASTYAVGQVARSYFQSKGSLVDVDIDWAKDTYADLLEKGKKIVADIENEKPSSNDAYDSLEKLGRLREQNVVTDEEFEAKKRQLFEQL